jgi:aminomethyltransferase
MTGYDAFHESAALADLSSRGRIIATGEDRKRLLHALTTNQIEKLIPGEGVYAFFLNAQGRVLADAIILCRENDLLISVEPQVCGKIYAHIDRHIIADDVTLADVSESTSELAVEGPNAAAILAELGAVLPTEPFGFTDWDGISVVLASATGVPGYRLVVPAEAKGSLMDSLTAAGAVAAAVEEMEIVRLEHGTPRYGVDFTESHIAQETGLAHALNFNKGCYLGQEIVERVRSRGHINKVLTPLEVESGSAPAPGAKVAVDGTEAGEITSAAQSPRSGYVRALAYIRTAALASAGSVTVDGAPAKLVQKV